MPRRTKGLVELTGSGDDGSTALLGGGRVPKTDLRIEAYGTVDEASSAIGLAKSLARSERVRAMCEEVQRGLYRLGAQLATNPSSARTYAQIEADDVLQLERLAAELEDHVKMPEGFVLPGVTPASAAFDVARTVVRRCERRVIALAHREGAVDLEVQRYLNRLSLLLFMLARYEEDESGVAATAARGESAPHGRSGSTTNP